MIDASKKSEAIKLRQAGFSIREIAKQLDIAQSTSSLFLRSVVLNKKAKEILTKKRVLGREKATQTLVINRKRRQGQSVELAWSLLGRLKVDKEIAFLVASLSYECEGDKSEFGSLVFTNSDPLLVKMFLSALRKSFIMDESKFRVAMHLHEYHNEKKEKEFWSEITGIPKVKFMKTFHKKESGINKKDGYRGCVQIKYFDVSIKRTLLATKNILAKKMGL